MVIIMIDKKLYAEIVKKNSPNSKTRFNCLKAFIFGGAICAIGEGIFKFYTYLKIPEYEAKILCSSTLILLGIILTALHLYEKIAKHAGAGTLVPITGFANSMCSPAIEFKSEGLITGLGAKLFIICGPVIAYGISASVIYGIILYIFGAWLL